ncbi:fasciclin [Humibacillus sp. DSM 29435]|uniref:fasciclin domain-containing protein n=1 Tax=Humibacillus sp. DSM 29435 TaxID=1869167 RepID=UPI00087292EB|nr:fasciclin domain-containing protein [Humibacillus sp. DSM 29435]OFE18837.1 fasciclin [Humibacillus sp. DSM 29435]
MKKRHLVPIVALIAGGMAAPAAVAAPTSAAKASTTTTTKALGDRSLATVLLANGGGSFDRNWYDYDILTQAVLAVLKAKPDSPVGLLTQGDVALTAFLPSDRAFQVLTRDLTHKWYGSEKQVFNALVKAVGVDAIEQVLLYHVIPGATITSKDALKANGATLNTALPGATIKVKVLSKYFKLIQLKDNDPNDINPIINPRAFDINKGNKQIAHGVIFVLRPADL